jgi:type IV fimbrial biogenesis protein FimT
VIELMITLAVLAIITSLALPSYRTILEKRQVTSGAEQVGAFLSAVQIEAVKRNEPIAVSYARSDVDSWCVGLSNAAASCDCTITDATDGDACTIDGVLRVFQSGSLNYPGVMNAMTGDGAFVFDPVRGLMEDHTDAASLQLLSSSGKYALNVDISATGRVKICSGDSSKQVPGYASC